MLTSNIKRIQRPAYSSTYTSQGNQHQGTHSAMTAPLYLQERFLLKEGEESELKWYVPLTWTTKSEAPTGFENTTTKAWLLPNETSKQLPNIEIKPDEWIIFNNLEAGMFLWP
jgi:hypothetical protein